MGVTADDDINDAFRCKFSSQLFILFKADMCQKNGQIYIICPVCISNLSDLFRRVKPTRDICELRNMINVGYLITRQAIERHESRGLHYNIDYPPKPRKI